jgi:hypothetical protein
MEDTPFRSQNVITQHISEANLKAYFVGFDYTNYRLEHLVNVLEKVIAHKVTRTEWQKRISVARSQRA